MNRRIYCLSVLSLAALALVASTAPAEDAGGPSATLTTRTVNTIPTADGAIQITIAPGWELNTKLAEDNLVYAFIHPGGYKVGDELAVWFLVDRCQRYLAEDSPKLLKRVLQEGADHGFVLREKITLPTADGRLVTNCFFEPAEDGTERGLALLPTESGAVTFRYQCAAGKEWETRRPEIEGMLRGMRFFPTQTSKEVPAPEK